MNKLDKTAKQMEKMKSMKLSDSSRTRMKNDLLEYAKFHTAKEGVRVEAEGRSIKHVPVSTFLERLKISYMPIAILVAVMIGGGTSLAAQGAVPGDILYPVKTGFNESVRSALALGVDAEARLQADLIEERVEEAEKLKARGELDANAIVQLSNEIAVHTKKIDELSGDSNKADSEGARLTSRIALSLENFFAVVDSNGKLAMETEDGAGVSVATRGSAKVASPEMMSDKASMEMGTDDSVGVATMMAVEEISPEELSKNTEARVEAISDLTIRYEAEFSADALLEINSSLEEARDLIAKAKTKTAEEAREVLYMAADLVGEIEAMLSLMGRVKIDPDTGAIVDINFDAEVMHDTEDVVDDVIRTLPNEPEILPIDPEPVELETTSNIRL